MEITQALKLALLRSTTVVALINNWVGAESLKRFCALDILFFSFATDFSFFHYNLGVLGVGLKFVARQVGESRAI